MLGFSVLPGNTRVRTQSSGLVRLGQLSGSGPAGLVGPPGPAVDTSQYYNKATMDIMLGLKEDNIVSTPGTGTGLVFKRPVKKIGWRRQCNTQFERRRQSRRRHQWQQLIDS